MEDTATLREEMLEAFAFYQAERKEEDKRIEQNRIEVDQKWRARINVLREESNKMIKGLKEDLAEYTKKADTQTEGERDNKDQTRCGEPVWGYHHRDAITVVDPTGWTRTLLQVKQACNTKYSALQERLEALETVVMKREASRKSENQPLNAETGETNFESKNKTNQDTYDAQHRWETLEPTVLTPNSPYTSKEESTKNARRSAKPISQYTHQSGWGGSCIGHRLPQGSYPTLPTGHRINRNYKGSPQDYDPYWVLKLKQRRMSRELIKQQQPCYHTECQRQQQWHTPPPPRHQRGPYPPQYTQEQVSRMFRM